MSVRFPLAIILGMFLLNGSQLRAGLYNAGEPLPGPVVKERGVQALGFSQFEDVLSSLIAIGVEQAPGSKLTDSPQRKHYLSRAEELQAKARTGRLTLQDRVNWSAYLMRLRKYDEAVQALEPVMAEARQNFMVTTNLATAHQLAGHLDRALVYLQQLKDLWPQTWPGFTKQQLEWLRTAEKYHLEIVKLRYREVAQRSPGRAPAHETLDDLFHGAQGPVRFVGESGQYEAGKLAKSERAMLPPDALAIVQQLIIWLPDDTRLYWLLGELYNADGDVEAAAKIFDDCVGNVRRFSAPELREHRQIVQEAKPKAAIVVLEPVTERPGMPAPSPPQPGSLPNWLPDTGQLVAVGGIAALAVLALGYFQIREMRRRRRSV
jgi:tetratricopeptide (TPR) repeat protein